jgi:hypothetical protein
MQRDRVATAHMRLSSARTGLELAQEIAARFPSRSCVAARLDSFYVSSRYPDARLVPPLIVDAKQIDNGKGRLQRLAESAVSRG